MKRIRFVPCAAHSGLNVSTQSKECNFEEWSNKGQWGDRMPTVLDVLDTLEPPTRDVEAPLRMPLTNVFRGQTAIASGIAAAGRVVSGLIATGDRLRVVPGDEVATVRGESIGWSSRTSSEL